MRSLRRALCVRMRSFGGRGVTARVAWARSWPLVRIWLRRGGVPGEEGTTCRGGNECGVGGWAHGPEQREHVAGGGGLGGAGELVVRRWAAGVSAWAGLATGARSFWKNREAELRMQKPGVRRGRAGAEWWQLEQTGGWACERLAESPTGPWNTLSAKATSCWIGFDLFLAYHQSE